jgi:hypothetical protein
VVQAAQDRRSLDGGARGLAEAGRAESLLPAKPGRRARQALFAVRFTGDTLARLKTGRRVGIPDGVALNVLDVREVEAPVA